MAYLCERYVGGVGSVYNCIDGDQGYRIGFQSGQGINQKHCKRTYAAEENKVIHNSRNHNLYDRYILIPAVEKYFTISGMPIASSQYWNMVYGGTPEEVLEDKEGLQTMRTLGKNMAFLMKSIQMGKEKWDFPKKNRQFLQIFIIIVKNEEDCLWNIQH